MNTNILKHLRLFHRLSARELAEKLNCSASYLSGLESGRRPITLKILEKYSIVFDMPVSDLVRANEALSDNTKAHPKWFSKWIEWILAGEECFLNKDKSVSKLA